MTRPTLLALGAVAALPAATFAVAPFLARPLIAFAGTSEAAATAVPLVSLAILAAGLAVSLHFVWRAAGQEGRGLGWKLAWVLALSAGGVIAAPAYWYLHVWCRRAGAGG